MAGKRFIYMETHFDDQPTGSIGDVVVSPSNPNVGMLAVVKVDINGLNL
jgi:hypothetical protein